MTGTQRHAAAAGRRGPLSSTRLGNRGRAALVLAACAILMPVAPARASAAGAAAAGRARPAGAHARVGPVHEVSRGCKGQNAEVEQAVDYPYVYEVWMGCRGIGFARSTDGGRSFGPALPVPGAAVPGTLRVGRFFIPKKGWDPAVAVAPDGTVYVSYMVIRHHSEHPAVAASVDHGASFTRVTQLMPPAQAKVNWGDRDFIAVASTGTVYLTWIYGHNWTKVIKGTGPTHVFIQKSANRGKTWSRMAPVSPRRVQAAAAPLLVEPGGRIDVLMWVPHHDAFTSSADGGRSWSRLVPVRPGAGRISFGAMGIDAALGIDAAGVLYATWNTQRPGGDIGWLSDSTDHGRTWSPARRVTQGQDNSGHIMAVAGGGPGIAYAGWLADNPRRGIAQYLRPFSVHRGWLSAPVRVSRRFGAPGVWPGDTIGMSVLPRGHGRPRVMVSWGSAVSRQISQIWAASVTGLSGRN